MATAANLRDYLMRYVGVQAAAHLTAAPGKDFAVRMAANMALTEILGGKRSMSRTLPVRGPTTVTLGAVTSGSTAITFTGYQEWMDGCCIVIDGDRQQNRLTRETAATVSLESPYQGSTGADVSAIIYQDAVNMDAQIQFPMDPVYFDSGRITMMSTREDLLRVHLGDHARQFDGKPMQPPRWAIVTDGLVYNGAPITRWLFDSLPLQAGKLSFTAGIAAPQIATWADARPAYLPNGMDETILFPWALYKLSTDPDFIGSKGDVAVGFQEASQRWEAFNPKGPGEESLDLYGVGL